MTFFTCLRLVMLNVMKLLHSKSAFKSPRFLNLRLRITSRSVGFSSFRGSNQLQAINCLETTARNFITGKDTSIWGDWSIAITTISMVIVFSTTITRVVNESHYLSYFTSCTFILSKNKKNSIYPWARELLPFKVRK